MIFASQIFLFWFLPLVLLAYYIVPVRARSLLLTIASFVFYGWWRIDFTVLMLFSTVLDFFIGGSIGRAGQRLATVPPDSAEAARLIRKRKLVLTLSICANLGLLGYFKYMNFGVESLSAILTAMGLEGVSWPSVVLPVGISFYTFQTMSYAIDVYRGEAPPVASIVDFSCFVTLFPQLVAGPIVRYQTLADQLRGRTHTWDKFALGTSLFQIGFAKKILLADTVSRIADSAYALAAPSTCEAWLGTLAYAFQIYFDFSGYSDMAVGLGLMFGFEFPVNFDSPYKSRSVTEFWRRWHVSLSTWLRDYLYIPLGGNRGSEKRTYVNLMITMLLGGLWHGAAWTYVAWGAYQGVLLAFERFTNRRPLYWRTPVVVQVLLTFAITLGGWVFFRATDIGQAGRFLSAMVGFGEGDAGSRRFAVDGLQWLALALCAGIAWFLPNSNEVARNKTPWIVIGAALVFPLAICHLYFQRYSPFLYFQF
ncbi:MAG: MBOAT family protein [Planctomycetes bacterium]|nr:MBOAT family protein [Planctomycetota bacterium]